MLRFSNRIRLMRQHFEQMDPDIMGLSEVDALSGTYPDAFLALQEMLKQMGYDCMAYDKVGGASASAIFWKVDKF